MISSISNPQIKNLIQLQNKSKARKEQRAFVVEGIKMVKEALSHGILKIYVSESYFKQNENDFLEDFTGVPYEIVTESVM